MAEFGSSPVALPEIQQEEEEEKAGHNDTMVEEARSEERESPGDATPEKSKQPAPTSPEAAAQMPSSPELSKEPAPTSPEAAAQMPSSPELPTTPEPAVPKRAKSGWMLFGDAHREEVCEQIRAKSGGKLAIPEVGRELGQRWAKLEEAEKAKYAELAVEDKVRYEAALEEYVERTGHKPEKRKRKVDRDILFVSASKPAAKGRRKAQQATEVGGEAAGDEAEPATPVRPRAVRRRPLTTLDVDAKVLAEAQRLCMEGQFMEFASCPEVLEAGINAKKAASARALMKALQKAEGVVAEARRRMIPKEVVEVEDVD